MSGMSFCSLNQEVSLRLSSFHVLGMLSTLPGRAAACYRLWPRCVLCRRSADHCKRAVAVLHNLRHDRRPSPVFLARCQHMAQNSAGDVLRSVAVVGSRYIGDPRYELGQFSGVQNPIAFRVYLASAFLIVVTRTSLWTRLASRVHSEIGCHTR